MPKTDRVQDGRDWMLQDDDPDAPWLDEQHFINECLQSMTPRLVTCQFFNQSQRTGEDTV